MTVRDPLEYVLNRMENAAQSDNPAKNGYGAARRELLSGIITLRTAIGYLQAENNRLRSGLEDIVQKIENTLKEKE